ncbi:hypothetical protein GCM10023108_25070 [Saccharopolyspora hordei]
MRSFPVGEALGISGEEVGLGAAALALPRLCAHRERGLAPFAGDPVEVQELAEVVLAERAL